MKHNLAVLAVLVLAAVAVVPASAQSTTLKANIPFNFSAGWREMPAGDYNFGSWSSTIMLVWKADSDYAGYLVLRSTQAPAGTSREKSALIFHRVGDQYFLRQIVDGSRSSVRDIPMSPTERELTESVDSAKAYETVVILARL